jgi:hypothetical protein
MNVRLWLIVVVSVSDEGPYCARVWVKARALQSLHVFAVDVNLNSVLRGGVVHSVYLINTGPEDGDLPPLVDLYAAQLQLRHVWVGFVVQAAVAGFLYLVGRHAN